MTTTRLTELRKDIDNAFEEIRNMKAEQKDFADGEKFKWQALSNERSKEKEASDKFMRFRALYS